MGKRKFTGVALFVIPQIFALYRVPVITFVSALLPLKAT